MKRHIRHIHTDTDTIQSKSKHLTGLAFSAAIFSFVPLDTGDASVATLDLLAVCTSMSFKCGVR